LADRLIYQIYPRSFRDSGGDGIGDLVGIRQRLDYVRSLGVTTLWLSPFYPSPRADGGYDITDHTAVDPVYGTLADFDSLVGECHRRGLEIIVDLVLCHTSIEHRWFRVYPDRYVWSECGPPNNWVAAFGGSAWTRDVPTGRWYLHSFYPEQPDLNWRNPVVEGAMHDVARFWLRRGVDGFRLDALTALVKDEALRDDPPAMKPFPLPLHPQRQALELRHSRNSPDLPAFLGRLRTVVGEALLVGEVGLPTADLDPYLEHLDLAFAFETFHARFDADVLRASIEAAAALGSGRGAVAWVLSNHDYSRLASRAGAKLARAAALLLLTLPGAAVVYQGDELGLEDGREGAAPGDRAGRDPYRTPIPWEPGPGRGFTSGRPWLPLPDGTVASVAEQESDPTSMLHFYRELVRLRSRLGHEFAFLRSEPGVLAYRRGPLVVSVNLTPSPKIAPNGGTVTMSTHLDGQPGLLEPYAGTVTNIRPEVCAR
jgi:alpha-glucosidase